MTLFSSNCLLPYSLTEHKQSWAWWIKQIIEITLIFYSFDKLIALTISTVIVFYSLIILAFKNKEIIETQRAFIQDNKVLESQIDFIESLPISVQYNKNQYFNKF